MQRKCTIAIVNFQCLWHTAHTYIYNFLLSLPLWFTASVFSLNLKSSIWGACEVEWVYIHIYVSLCASTLFFFVFVYRYQIRRASIWVHGTNLSSKNPYSISLVSLLAGFRIKIKSTQWIRSVWIFVSRKRELHTANVNFFSRWYSKCFILYSH